MTLEELEKLEHHLMSLDHPGPDDLTSTEVVVRLLEAIDILQSSQPCRVGSCNNPPCQRAARFLVKMRAEPKEWSQP